MTRTLGLTLALTLATAGLMVPAAAPAAAAPDNYTPPPGPTFNSPVGSTDVQRAIFRKIIRSINSVPRGEEIYVFSWNFLTREGADALLRAQRRNVRVRLLMDDKNLVLENGDTNSPFYRLRSGLRRGNEGRRKARRSWARVCVGTCRGGGGAAHSKFFLYSKAGRARKVFMQGSANLTVASTTNQWNDIYTHVGNDAVWRWARKIFNEAARDQKAREVYSAKDFGAFKLMMFPNTGTNSPDPVMQMLKRVRCQRATNTRHGRTVLRMAPDVLRNARGMRIAKKIRALWRDGCDIHLGYTVVGIDIGRYLREGGHRRGPVPMKHLVQDFNNDGRFDNYFHLKTMTIRGNYAGDRSGHVVLNGSANWSHAGEISDENLGIYRNKAVVDRYQEHLDYWWYNFPSNRSSSGRLVFGTDQNAIYEDGTPVSDGTVNPFEKLAVD
jgi:phosphatidylserine/phosphatidylglycerophosphate/cardiolipin synthase-like enzyme